MVYAGKIGDRKYHLGVSGRLKDNNLIMWDEQTNSLWSQITGEALHGKSKGKTLGMLPAVFVGLGTWKRMHPETLVLDLSNVRVLCQSCNKPTRVEFKKLEDGDKVRICRKCRQAVTPEV